MWQLNNNTALQHMAQTLWSKSGVAMYLQAAHNLSVVIDTICDLFVTDFFSLFYFNNFRGIKR